MTRYEFNYRAVMRVATTGELLEAIDEQIWVSGKTPERAREKALATAYRRVATYFYPSLNDCIQVCELRNITAGEPSLFPESAP